MVVAELDSVKRKIKSIEELLNYLSDVKDAQDSNHSPPPPPVTLDREFRMYKRMTPEQLHEEKRQLQEMEILLLRSSK